VHQIECWHSRGHRISVDERVVLIVFADGNFIKRRGQTRAENNKNNKNDDDYDDDATCLRTAGVDKLENQFLVQSAELSALLYRRVLFVVEAGESERESRCICDARLVAAFRTRSASAFVCSNTMGALFEPALVTQRNTLNRRSRADPFEDAPHSPEALPPRRAAATQCRPETGARSASRVAASVLCFVSMHISLVKLSKRLCGAHRVHLSPIERSDRIQALNGITGR
jgi:hypothetical protein